MAKKAEAKKDKFADLPSEFKDAIVGCKDAVAIKARLAEVALAQEENKLAMKADEDLAQKKAEAKEAAAQYTEASKANNLKIQFCRRVLRDRGQLSSDFDEESA